MRYLPLFTLAVTAMLSACGAPENDQPDSKASEVAAKPAQTAPAQSGARPKSFAQCIACHRVERGQHGVGPSLAGVYGAEAGHVEDFAYSTAMRDSGITWDNATLDAYLENPRANVPGTKMSFVGLKDAEQRAELIEYLKTL